MAISLTDIQEITGLFGKQAVNTNNRKYKVVSVEATTDATGNTINLNTYVPCTAIVGALSENYNFARASTASTFTGTTVTTAGHTGAGLYKAVWMVYE